MRLKQEVQQPEAELSLQQQESESQPQATSATSSLSSDMHQAMALWRQQVGQADEGSGSQCETLTQDRGDLRQLCRRDASPQLSKVLQWLARRHTAGGRRDESKYRDASRLFLKLAAVCAGWLVVVRWLR